MAQLLTPLANRRPSSAATNRHAADVTRSLPFELWPHADRLAWQAACRPKERLRRGGAASHLKAVTRNDLQRRYGYFLGSVKGAGALAGDRAAGVHVTPANVDRYVAALKARVSSVTAYGSIYKLRRITQL